MAFKEALRYAKEREAFGKRLTSMQVIRHKLAEMETKITVAKSMNYSLGLQLAAGEYLVKEVSMAKNFSATTAMEVTYEAVQILGGMGYMRESAVERLSRDARLLPIGGGTQEIMNEIIAKFLCS
jgi:acyl-CoA dehydrogenase